MEEDDQAGVKYVRKRLYVKDKMSGASDDISKVTRAFELIKG